MTTSHQFDNGLRLSPFDPRWRSGIDWTAFQREANLKEQHVARAKERSAGKQYLDQPPNFRPPKAKPRPIPRPKPVAKPKPSRDDLGASSTSYGRKLDSKAGRMRLAMLQRGPMNANELAQVADVDTGRKARDLLGHDLKLGLVKVDKTTEPVRYFVPENPPTPNQVI